MKFSIYILLLCFLFGTSLSNSHAQTNSCEGKTTVFINPTNTEVPTPSINPATVIPSSAVTATDGYRKIWWVHGLGGNDGAWQRAAAATSNFVTLPTGMVFPPRQADSHLPNLSSFTSSIEPTAAKLIEDYLEVQSAVQEPEDHIKNIIIGHSQGGIISRWADYIYDKTEEQIGSSDRRFGGVVTFGSANGGAQIINNKDDLQQFLNESCEELSAGFISEVAVNLANQIETTINQSLILDLFINEDEIADQLLTVSNVSIGFFCNVLDDVLRGLVLEDLDTPLSEEYAVGTPQIDDQLNAYDSPTIPKVAFYGTEVPDEMIWRSFYYFTNNPNTADYFSAINDDRGVESADNNQLYYQAKTIAYTYMLDNSTFPDINYYIPCLGLEEFLMEELGVDELSIDYDNLICSINTNNTSYCNLINSWEKGFNWWRDANDRWKVIIGALEPVNGNVYDGCECAYPAGESGWTPFIPMDFEVADCTSDFPDRWCRTLYAQGQIGWTEKAADGVVLAESAIAMPGAQEVEMPGSSHMQMRNDDQLREKLLLLFEGEYGPFFKTGIQQ